MRTLLPGLHIPTAEPAPSLNKVRPGSVLAGRYERVIWRPFARKDVKRYLLAVQLYDRTTRLKGRRNGALGHVACEVYRTLTGLMDYQTGRLEPTIATIAERCNRAYSAVVVALNALRAAGFLTWVRRYVPTGETGRGPQVKQTSNAYRLMLPPAAERLLGPTGGEPAPLSADLALEADERGALANAYAAQETGLWASLDKLGAGVHQRESAKRSPTTLESIFRVGNAEKGHI